MTNEQPELRWAPLPSKPDNRRRVWLIVGLGLAGLVILGVMLFFLIPRGGAPDPGASGTPSPSATPTATSTPTATPTPTTGPVEPPVVTEPPVIDPTVEAFRAQVGGWLEDGGRGLELITGLTGPDAASVVQTLQEDSQRMSDAVAPSSIATQWRDGVNDYMSSLASLRSIVDAGGDTTTARSASQASLQNLNALLGL